MYIAQISLRLALFMPLIALVTLERLEANRRCAFVIPFGEKRAIDLVSLKLFYGNVTCCARSALHMYVCDTYRKHKNWIVRIKQYITVKKVQFLQNNAHL